VGTLNDERAALAVEGRVQRLVRRARNCSIRALTVQKLVRFPWGTR
jgi:hypothetical protein